MTRDTLDLVLQPDEGALSNWIYENCEVIDRSDLGDGVTHLRIRVAPEKRYRLARLAGTDAARHCRGGVAILTGSLSGGLAGLRLIPELVHLFECGVFRCAAFGAERSLDAAKPPHEFRVGIAQGRLRIDAEMARDIRHDEQEIAELLGDFL